MIDQDNTNRLLRENAELRRRVALLEDAEAHRRQAEEELAKSKAILNAAIECLPFDFFALDPQGRCILQNAVSRRYFGEALGKTAAEVYPDPQVSARWQEKTRRALSGEKVEGDVVFSVAGHLHHFHNILVPVRHEGKLYGMLGLNVDITAYKQLEEALRKARDELELRVRERTAELARANEGLAIFRRFAEASSQGFSMADMEARIVYMNPALRRMLGADGPESYIGRHVSVCFPPEANRLGKEEVEPALAKFGHWEGELPLLSRKGKLIPTWQHSFLIRDEQGNPVRIAVVITDITQRKRAEEALHKQRRTLEHMLRASDHERQLIAYDIHDGLAQELAGALMQFQVYEHLKDAKPAEARRAYQGGLALLRQAHVEARRLISGVRPPILDESGVIAAIAHLVHDPAFDDGPRVDFHSRVHFSRLDPVVENVIYRIVQEGLTNARNHSHSPRILVSLRQRGDRLRIVVRDWGVGFDAKAARENRFGLEGIRERARLLGGRCGIRSQPGQGSCLIVELPVLDEV